MKICGRNCLETNKTKVFTYLGFAKRSKKLTLGVNSVQTLKKGVYLLILCSKAAENTRKEAKNLADRFGCTLLESVKYELSALTFKENCRLAAVCDANLAKAIIENAGEDFKVLSGGSKG